MIISRKSFANPDELVEEDHIFRLARRLVLFMFKMDGLKALTLSLLLNVVGRGLERLVDKVQVCIK